jgi:hypothetical protein
MLRRNNVVQIERERLFQNVTLGLAILLGGENELLVELGVNLWGELLGGWHR